MNSTTQYWLIVIVLALVLVFPVSQLIWSLSIRQRQKEADKKGVGDLTIAQINKLKNAAYLKALFLCLAVSTMYNILMFGLPLE